MKAYELMALVAKEPERYEGKRYKVTAGNSTHLGERYSTVEVHKDFNAENGMTLVGVKGDDATKLLVSVTTRTELEEIQEPVDFMTAVKANYEDKTIICRYGEEITKYRPKAFLCDQDNDPISSSEILFGKWYIEA
jgi:hypothetical protein